MLLAATSFNILIKVVFCLKYLSSLTCYIGFIIGTLFGQELKIARWIFAISGGTTLYIGLAVLVSFSYSNLIRNFLIEFYFLSFLK